MFAAVDLGSNSFRLHVAEMRADGIQVVRSARDPVRLGAGLDSNNNLTTTAMQTALASLQGFAKLLAEYRLEAVRVVGTNALRIACNAAQFLPLAEKAVGYPVEVISGEEEGRLIYLGVAANSASRDETRLVVDIGGGSTELVLGRGLQIRRVESFSIGTVLKNMLFFPEGRIDAASFDAAILSARSRFEDMALVFNSSNWEVAYGSSGTIRAVGDALQRNGLGDGRITPQNMQALKERLIGFGHVSRIQLVGMKPDRADVICGGIAILIGLMQELGIAEIIPVQAGLRMGLIWDLHLRTSAADRREQAVQEFAQRFRVDLARARQAAVAAETLYGEGGHQGNLARLVSWAGLLHEAGAIVSPTGFHKHGAYMLENADMPGFSGREQKRLAQLVLGQKGNLRKLGDALADPDFARAVLAVRLAAVLLHTHETEAARQFKLKMNGRAELEVPGALMQRHPTLSWWLARERSEWEDVGIRFALKPA